ncbi:MAG: amino acid carrier protein [Alcanivoracaceae bacterium]|nr:amino acid carrier protein [Alcanivoracaceae bacterium]
MNLIASVESALSGLAAWLWGPPMVILLVGGGLFLVVHSRLLPYRHFRHAIRVARGDYDHPDDAGQVPHFHALSTALSGTLGLGNVAGVAVAITMGGPGAIFWMWVTALVGVVTKFYTCTLAIMYRGRDSQGELQGGPMYVVREGLGPRWWPLALLFALAGLVGTLPVFQANQLVALLRDTIAIPAGLATGDEHFLFDLACGAVIALLVLTVVVGHVQRVGRVTARLVPAMVLGYLLLSAGVLVQFAGAIPSALLQIISDAFSGEAAAGGLVGTVIMIGVRRGAFSNEAGIGTEAMAHGAAKTSEPVREGLVAMLGPIIDTLLVCTLTALVILVTGVWDGGDLDGVTLTAMAFEFAYPGVGAILLTVMVTLLALSTILSFWYYGSKCLGYLAGAEHQHHYIWIYSVLVVVGSVSSLTLVISLIDAMYALMAVPTMVSTLLLAPRVRRAAREYFRLRVAD